MFGEVDEQEFRAVVGADDKALYGTIACCQSCLEEGGQSVEDSKDKAEPPKIVKTDANQWTDLIAQNDFPNCAMLTEKTIKGTNILTGSGPKTAQSKVSTSRRKLRSGSTRETAEVGDCSPCIDLNTKLACFCTE